MRLLHTSDWHLGHHLHQLARTYEHQQFLAWLVDRIEHLAVDAVLITGDIFDTANPSAEAEEMWFDFLAAATRRRPGLQVVAIAGNHDSGARLEAAAAMLRALRVHVVGRFDPDRPGEVVVPIEAEGRTAAFVAAVPYLRPADMPRVEGGDLPVLGIERAYELARAAAATRRGDGDAALIAMGHLYMVGCEVSLLSERRILGGTQHAIPASIFSDDFAYVALGHMHKAQRVGRDHVRYAGSPIPLSLGEGRYRHQVVVCDFDGRRLTSMEALAVPRAVDVIRIPSQGSAPLDEVLRAIDELEPLRGDAGDPARPYLEACVRLDEPVPNLQHKLGERAASRRPRLVKIGAEYTGDGLAAADAFGGRELRELDPEDVFRRRYTRATTRGEPPAELLTVFREIARAVEDKVAEP